MAKYGVAALFLILLSLVTGCALLKSSPGEPIVSPTEAASTAADGLPLTVLSPTVGTPAPTSSHSTNQAVPPVVLNSVNEVSALDRADLKVLSKIGIHLANAEITLSSGAGIRKGHLKIEKISGDADCKVRVQDSEKGIEISEPLLRHSPDGHSAVVKVKSALPVVSKCRFSIEIGLKKAADTNIELVRGTLSVEGWDEPLRVKMEWGEIDVGTVGELSVVCGRCSLTGEGVEGPLHYTLETGNVGLTGLAGSVEGQTLGDTVLKWRKLRADSNVKLSSRAGDVILFFPETVPLAIDLKAPHGEVNSRFQTGAHGVPVSVSAELGNVKVYRSTKEAVSQ
ncbi:MAG: hypothetical protein HY074_04515 [Deltaproteobacteria bacterium]|nr:hypothetical protein [Deltaproteobacteria bacterium]